MSVQDSHFDSEGAWFCGHCRDGPMSRRYVTACVNCFRPKDHLSLDDMPRSPQNKGFKERKSATETVGISVTNENVIENKKDNNSSQIPQKISRSKARIKSRENVNGDNFTGKDNMTYK